MTPREFRQEKEFEFDHFIELTSTGISPNYVNIELFAHEYHKAKLNLLTYPMLLDKLKEAINYTRCSIQLLCKINGWENITLGKKYTMLFEDEAMYGFRNDINEIVERSKQHFELLKQ
jgi:hypothetical protein